MEEKKSYFVMKSITEDNMCELCARNDKTTTFPYCVLCNECKHGERRKEDVHTCKSQHRRNQKVHKL